MATWQPDEAQLTAVTRMLSAVSGIGATHEQVCQATRQWEQLKQHPHMCQYLCVVFADERQPLALRQQAGVQLKNCVRWQISKLDEPAREYVRQTLLPMVAQTDGALQSTAAFCVAAVAATLKLETWPQLISQLAGVLANPAEQAAHVLHGVMQTTSMLCVDASADAHLQQVMPSLIPLLCQYLKHPDDKMRLLALRALAPSVLTGSPALLANKAVFMEALLTLLRAETVALNRLAAFDLAKDMFISLSRFVAERLGDLLDISAEALQQRDVHDEVGIAVADFIREAAANALPAPDESYPPATMPMEPLAERATRLLSLLVPHLCMKDAELRELLEQEKEVPPLFKRVAGDGGGDDDDDDDDEEALFGNGPSSLRRAAAQALEMLVALFGGAAVSPMLALVEPLLTSEGDWRQREGGVLAISCMADGARNHMLEPLSQLMPWLRALLQDEAPLLRATAMWTLGKFPEFLTTHAASFTDALLPVVIQQMGQEKGTYVRRALCLLLKRIVEQCDRGMVRRHLPLLMAQLRTCLGVYGARAFAAAVDLTTIVLEHCENEGITAENLQQGATPQQAAILQGVVELLQPMLQVWGALRDDEPLAIPVMECLFCFPRLLQLHGAMRNLVPQMWERCVHICRHTAQEVAEFHAAMNTPQGAASLDYPSRDAAACALDMMESIAGAIGGAVDPLLQQWHVVDLVVQHLLTDDESEMLRQSCLALLGHVAMHCPVRLRHVAPQLMPLLAEQLNASFPMPCCNAAWVIGVCCDQIPDAVAPHVGEIVKYAVEAMRRGTKGGILDIHNRVTDPRPMLDNLAVTFSRLLVLPGGLDALVAAIDSKPFFARQWCIHLARFAEPEEKARATLGLFQVVAARTQAFTNLQDGTFQNLCALMASWAELAEQNACPDQVRQPCQELLRLMRGHMGSAPFESLPPQIRQHLRRFVPDL